MKKVASVEEYLENNDTWKNELVLLRNIINAEGLEETIKWSAPTYCYKNKNVVGMAAFKNHFGIWFFQGALLNDDHNLLENAQEGKTKALRQMRFTNIDQIDAKKIAGYIKEAMKLVDDGKEIKPVRNKAIDIPEALQKRLTSDTKLKAAFDALTLGKQRDYANHIAEAKREATKEKRLEKIIPMILSGIGLYDKYKNC